MESKLILEARGLGIDFGGLTAVNNLDLQIEQGTINGLIGPNGAGKTTVFNMLTKVYTPTRGTIFLDGKDTAAMDTVTVAKNGIARTFQNIRLFPKLSVLDTVKTGMHRHIAYSGIDAFFHTPRYRREEKMAEEKAHALLDIFDLEEEAERISGNLPYGAQRRLEIARAMATEPKLLLLDEPAAGMNPQETEELMAIIRYIRDHFHIAILLIEHDMKLVMGICEQIIVLNFGMLLAQGKPEAILQNADVVKAYLGE